MDPTRPGIKTSEGIITLGFNLIAVLALLHPGLDVQHLQTQWTIVVQSAFGFSAAVMNIVYMVQRRHIKLAVLQYNATATTPQLSK